MSFHERQAVLLPEFRASAYYFTFYMGPGAALVFLPIWLDQMGMTAAEIGILNSVPTLAMLLLNLVVGRLADRAKDWRDVIIVGSIAGGIAPFGLFFAFDFWTILVVWTLVSLPTGLLNPVLDAAIMRLTRRNGSDFGSIRAWGTFGAMLCNVGIGVVVAKFGAAAFLPLLTILLVLRAIVSLQLPRFRTPPTQPVLGLVEAPPRAAVWSEFLRPYFLLPMIGYAAISASHGVLAGFGTLLLNQQGLSEVSIGVLIAIGTAAESAMMLAWRHFNLRFPARMLIIFAGLFAALRWVSMAFAPPFEVLVVLQLLNGLSFGMCLLATLDFITNQTSENVAAEIMSLFNLVVQAVWVLCLLAFGVLIAQLGFQTYLLAGLLALTGALCATASIRLRPDTRQSTR